MSTGEDKMAKIVALAGGVGGAKFVKGLAQVVPHQDLTVIVNTGDDFVHMGLNISPDLDTVMYTLAGLSNEITGWGRKDETWNTFESLKKMNSETWFSLGDSDLATHMERTRLLSKGQNLTEVTHTLCNTFGVNIQVLPMTDSPVTTIIKTSEFGEIPFQEYFVKHKFEPKLLGYYFKNIEKAKLNPITERRLEEADTVIFCPSNPWLSIYPILSVEGVKNILKRKNCIAISPIVGNRALKGPAAKIFNEMGVTASAYEVAKLYKGMITGMVLDRENENEISAISGCGIIPLVTDTIMKDDESKARLAKEVCNFASQLPKRK